MAKEVLATVKLQVPGGQATPAPPVGPALGQHGVNIGEFVSRFNEETKAKQGVIVPVLITIFKDRSFDMVMKSPPAAVLLKQAAQIAKGSPDPKREKVGEVTRKQVEAIAETKRADLDASDMEAAVQIIIGTARSMGIEVMEDE